MNDLGSLIPRYFPTLKTRDAELRAYTELPDETKSLMCPVFELTKSRITNRNPEGTVLKRLSQIFEALPASRSPFILDVTTTQHLQNKEISSFFEYEGGFRKWCDFLEEFVGRGIIPVLHYLLDDEGENKTQIDRLLRSFGVLAVRLDISDEAYREVVVGLSDLMESESLIVLLDRKFAHINEYLWAEHSLQEAVGYVIDYLPNAKIVPLVSTFPKFVLQAGYGSGDHVGRFPYREYSIWQNVQRQFRQHDLGCGDYASIHPIVDNGGGGQFIPRVDYPTSSEFLYRRYRRGNSEDDYAGYKKAASEIVTAAEYRDNGVWGNEMIFNAAHGALPAKNPAFWISVRSNIYMKLAADRLSNSPML